MKKQSKSKPRSFDRSLRVGDRAVSELELDPRNRRIPTPKEDRQIAKSIETPGSNVPVLDYAPFQVMDGQCRLAVVRLLKMMDKQPRHRECRDEVHSVR